MESNRKKPIASYNGYLMHQTVKSANGTKQFWRCATRACNGTAESIFGELNGLVERKSHDRCTQSPMAVVIKKKMTAVKQKAVESLATSTQAILSTAKTGSSVYEIESMPKDSNITRMINNAQKQKEHPMWIKMGLPSGRLKEANNSYLRLSFRSSTAAKVQSLVYGWDFLLSSKRSLAEAIYGEEDVHAQVRTKMMSFLLDNREKPYACFFTAIGDSSVSVEEYAAHFNQPSNEQLGGDISAVASSSKAL
uniref:FLYWCH-type domain-containing protein n=1 Tax=Ditylenchus dipsaci TaxID=166011 RepID=A0A915CNY8_9BILA